ncbi:MAG TPA: MFS transporter [Solirubrobacteraceae bacterium]|nr:MFS transporter [Solirubrobacteraceae bacterium]
MPRLPASLEVLRERDYRLLFTGQAVSLLGDGMFNVALAFAVLHLGGSATQVGLVFAARMVPMVACLLAGGVVADRLPRRAVMVAADVARLASQGAMAALLIASAAEIWTLAVLAGVTGAATGFFNPASTGLLPAVVAAERLQQANALRGLSMAAGQIAGPILAGVLVAVAGAGWALAVDAASFGVSAAFLVGLRLPPRASRAATSFLVDLREGWDTFRERTWLWTFVASAAVGNVLFASWNVLGPVVAERDLGGAAAWGVIVGAMGAGSIAGGLAALHARPRRPLLVATLAVAVFSLPLAGLALALPAPAIAAAALVSGGGLMLSNTVWESTLQRHIPAAALSRVSAYDWFGSMAFQPLGLALWGPVAGAIGIAPALWVAFVLQVASVLALLAVPDIRRLAPFPQAAPADLAAATR